MSYKQTMIIYYNYSYKLKKFIIDRGRNIIKACRLSVLFFISYFTVTTKDQPQCFQIKVKCRLGQLFVSQMCRIQSLRSILFNWLQWFPYKVFCFWHHPLPYCFKQDTNMSCSYCVHDHGEDADHNNDNGCTDRNNSSYDRGRAHAYLGVSSVKKKKKKKKKKKGKKKKDKFLLLIKLTKLFWFLRNKFSFVSLKV